MPGCKRKEIMHSEYRVGQIFRKWILVTQLVDSNSYAPICELLLRRALPDLAQNSSGLNARLRRVKAAFISDGLEDWEIAVIDVIGVLAILIAVVNVIGSTGKSNIRQENGSENAKIENNYSQQDSSLMSINVIFAIAIQPFVLLAEILCQYLFLSYLRCAVLVIMSCTLLKELTHMCVHALLCSFANSTENHWLIVIGKADKYL
ncbi:hypothetical protein CAPTEDRAFT_193451 [Capitella teleta]|uniref:Uncharacterized protein n=1 Tax=Capitella teleta TaxID=283909 RepID=R7TUA8_CAPTE|nr:hypothetical protein CAPTEDRAFT_193451 [Capitella teleta]|eukprot:ELT97493.1 hypothetical protein CAPTEDRAFT_193451 [Capitella teleta]